MTAENEVVPFDKNVPPIILRRGLYEFTRRIGMSDFAWVKADGTVHPLNENVDVTEFWKAFSEGVVYRLGRIEERVASEGDGAWKPHERRDSSYDGIKFTFDLWRPVETYVIYGIEDGTLEINRLGAVRITATEVVIEPAFDIATGRVTVAYDYQHRGKAEKLYIDGVSLAKTMWGVDD